MMAKVCYWCGDEIKGNYSTEKIDGFLRVFCSEKCKEEAKS